MQDMLYGLTRLGSGTTSRQIVRSEEDMISVLYFVGASPLAAAVLTGSAQTISSTHGDSMKIRTEVRVILRFSSSETLLMVIT